MTALYIILAAVAYVVFCLFVYALLRVSSDADDRVDAIAANGRRNTMSNLIDYAKAELARINKGGDDMQDLMDKHILDIIQVFSDQGHSGFSASYLTNRVERLMRFLPITPLQGTDDEWNDCGRERDSTPIFQNKRCSRVFKDGVGAYDVEAEVFSDNGGITWFTRGGHRVYIDFPYMPPTNRSIN